MRRRAFLSAGAAFLAAPLLRPAAAPARTLLATPSPEQLAWQRDELALFLHFGINTFTDREWGDGREEPAAFAPAALDAAQWARVAQDAGFRTLILTAKHHDGFCLWPTRTTAHSVASSPFRGGRGDVVREFTDACRAAGLGAGLYLSPWDRHEPSYGDSPRYNDLYCAQLTELLTQYGDVHQVWFDGANGEGPGGRKQEYDWPRIWALVRRLQPHAVIFSDAGPDVRWIGNESGTAGEPNWSAVDPEVVRVPGRLDAAGMRMLRHGDPFGTAWRPGEADVSIRPGWFHHPAEDARVRTTDGLIDLYFSSVGRNSKLLLNVPPTRAGLLHDVDVQRLLAFRARRDAQFAHDEIAGRPLEWRATGPRSATGELELDRSVRVGTADLREDIERGQVVAQWLLEGLTPAGWRRLAGGSTIGYRRLERFEPAEVRRVRLTSEGIAPPRPLRLALYAPA